MKRLLDGIKTAFEANSTLTTLFTGGLHFMEAPPGQAMPYVVMNVVASPQTQKYGGVGFAEPTIQFTVRAVGPATALAAAETFFGVWDDVTITLADSKQVFYARRTGEPIAEPDDPQLDEQGRDVTGWILVYDYATSG